MDRLQAIAADNLTQLTQVNDQWEAKDIEYPATKKGFAAVRDATLSLKDQVAAATVPETYQAAWADTVTAAEDLAAKAAAVITGLEAPDDGTLRREAVQAFTDATDAFNVQLDAVRVQTP